MQKDTLNRSPAKSVETTASGVQPTDAKWSGFEAFAQVEAQAEAYFAVRDAWFRPRVLYALVLEFIEPTFDLVRGRLEAGHTIQQQQHLHQSEHLKAKTQAKAYFALRVGGFSRSVLDLFEYELTERALSLIRRHERSLRTAIVHDGDQLD